MGNNLVLILFIHCDVQFYMVLVPVVCSYVIFIDMVVHTNMF